MRRNLASALIPKDDADWDVGIRDQLHNFARQPLVDTGANADVTY